MAYWLANSDGNQHKGVIKRFDPRFWSINFPRPMMAALTTTAPDALRVDAVFYNQDDLAGLIWEAEDRFDHPLLAYETARDFRGCRLSFDWQASNIAALAAINGPTLTIEGRDAAGAARSWFVRLANYAVGNRISLDFAALNGGFLLPDEADPVFAGDIDRLFISLVPPGFSASGGVLAAPIEASLSLTNIRCDGPASVLSVGDVIVPAHDLAIASGYDDSYNLAPARLLRNILALGYRGTINHYVGMSHYFRLEAVSGGLYVSSAGGSLNVACAAWHADFAARAKALDYDLIISLSYELFDEHCWNDWKQRAFNGDPALTGYTPPSALLSPANSNAMAYLQAVARAFMFIVTTAGHVPRFQVGEPWWWVMADGRICLYDAAAKAALGGNPVEIPTIRASLTAPQIALLDAAGVLLAGSTAALAAAVRLDHPNCERLILVYLPTVLDEAAPEAKRANVPLGWASPAFDVLQLEDYDWVTTGNSGATVRGLAVATQRLGYPIANQHYFAGFVLAPADRAQWRLIEAAAVAARKRGVAQTFVWALPQILRDGFTYFDQGDFVVDAFDDVDFPLALGSGASVTPGFSTAIVTTASGYEQRNVDWASARLRFDAGPGVRSEIDLQTLIAFFRARRGAAKAFRFRDPYDHSSSAMTGTPTPSDQLIGVGDGIQTRFSLTKSYGTAGDAEHRPITRPVAASVLVSVDGTAVSGWNLAPKGVISFTVPPPAGKQVRAGFYFDVPVRFETDSLSIDSASFLAGEAATVPLIEVREDAGYD
jgi:uncharacterized protein (TIGR02217 family)